MSAAPAPSVIGPTVWRGQDLEANDDWIHYLSDGEVDELASALEFDRQAPIYDLDQHRFPLSGFAVMIRQMLREIEYGRGFALLRGLPIGTRFSDEEATRIYWGIGSHLGSVVSQNRSGDLIGELRDYGPAAVYTRAYATSGATAFHTDSTDIVGLLCLRPSLHGGESLLASSAAIYNVVCAEHPEYVPILFKSFPVDWMNEEPSGGPGWYPQPMFCCESGYLSGALRWGRTISAMRFGDVPRLTAQEVSCLLYLESLSKRPGISMRMTLEPGDMQFVSNYTVLHARTGFVDDPTDPNKQRHLRRLWISRPSTGRPVSSEFDALRAGIPQI